MYKIVEKSMKSNHHQEADTKWTNLMMIIPAEEIHVKMVEPVIWEMAKPNVTAHLAFQGKTVKGVRT